MTVYARPPYAIDSLLRIDSITQQMMRASLMIPKQFMQMEELCRKMTFISDSMKRSLDVGFIFRNSMSSTQAMINSIQNNNLRMIHEASLAMSRLTAIPYSIAASTAVIRNSLQGYRLQNYFSDMNKIFHEQSLVLNQLSTSFAFPSAAAEDDFINDISNDDIINEVMPVVATPHRGRLIARLRYEKHLRFNPQKTFDAFCSTTQDKILELNTPENVKKFKELIQYTIQSLSIASGAGNFPPEFFIMVSILYMLAGTVFIFAVPEMPQGNKNNQ